MSFIIKHQGFILRRSSSYRAIHLTARPSLAPIIYPSRSFRWSCRSSIVSVEGETSSSISFKSIDDHKGHQHQGPLKVAIIGRPNVGKSTLFNRLTGGKGQRWTGGSALVTPIPGTTRDRKDAVCEFAGYQMRMMDTGGLEEEEDEAEEDDEEGDNDVAESQGVLGQVIPSKKRQVVTKALQGLINQQVHQAIEEADVVLFVLDARAGVGPEELHLGRFLHKAGAKAKTLLVANKAEGGVLNDTMQTSIYEAYQMGLGDPIPISAAHNEGITDLLGSIIEGAKKQGLEPIPDTNNDEKEQEDVITVAFVGMPNVGKSTLVNATLGEARLITSDISGTTRDAVLVDYQWKGHAIRLVDTAGIRKKGRQDHSTKLESLAVDEAMRALRFANVVVLVLDGQQLRLRRQEQVVADMAFKEGRGIVVAANKSDLLETSHRAYAQGVREQLQLISPQLGSVPVVPTCALSGRGVNALLPAVSKVYRAWNHRVNTGLLNRWLFAIQRIHSPPRAERNRTVKFKYMTQIKTRPPTFAVFTNVRELDKSYQKFLKNKLQEEFDLHGMEVRLVVKSTSVDNPYAPTISTPNATTSRAGEGKRRQERGRTRQGREGGSSSSSSSSSRTWASSPTSNKGRTSSSPRRDGRPNRSTSEGAQRSGGRTSMRKTRA